MSDEVLDDVMIKGSCKGKADAIVNCQCNIESAPVRCEQAERCMFYSYYKCSKQWYQSEGSTFAVDVCFCQRSDCPYPDGCLERSLASAGRKTLPWRTE